MVANSFDACGVPGGVKGPQPGVALSPLSFQMIFANDASRALGRLGLCIFMPFQNLSKPFETIALPCFICVFDGSCVLYLNCVVLELRVREFSPRWLQHGDGGTVETTCFVEAIDGC